MSSFCSSIHISHDFPIISHYCQKPLTMIKQDSGHYDGEPEILTHVMLVDFPWQFVILSLRWQRGHCFEENWNFQKKNMSPLRYDWPAAHPQWSVQEGSSDFCSSPEFESSALRTWHPSTLEGGRKVGGGKYRRGAPNLPEERRVPKRWFHCCTTTHTLSPMMYQLFQCYIVIDCHCMILKIDGVQRMPGKALESHRQGLHSLHPGCTAWDFFLTGACH